ncbi:MAG: hypothetical protein JSW39_15055 [Desulfobacterales bacterium]|nr:MAG: hypothetical protein JSW39_15055 [Desulfobacterales bacterium]
MTIKKDLQAVCKELNNLAKKLEKLIPAFEKTEKPRLKPAKTAPQKKAAAPTDTQIVLNYIKRSKKGVDTATLMKKTGFDQKKIWNIIFRATKRGIIQKVGKGLYSGVK